MLGMIRMKESFGSGGCRRRQYSLLGLRDRRRPEKKSRRGERGRGGMGIGWRVGGRGGVANVVERGGVCVSECSALLQLVGLVVSSHAVLFCPV